MVGHDIMFVSVEVLSRRHNLLKPMLRACVTVTTHTTWQYKCKIRYKCLDSNKPKGGDMLEVMVMVDLNMETMANIRK